MQGALIYGLWLLYKAEREGLPVRPVMMTFVGYLVLVDGAMNTLGAMIDVLANHSLLVRTFIMGTGLVFDAGYLWQYNTLLVGGSSAPGEKAYEVANGVVLFPMRIAAAWGFLHMKRWGLQWMVVTCWMGVYAWVAYMWNITTYSEMRFVDVLAPVWGWWLYNLWYEEHEPFRRVMERVNRVLMGGVANPPARVQAATLASAIAGAVIHPLVLDLDDESLRSQLLKQTRKLLPLR